MLTTFGDASRAPTCYDDTVDEARKRRRTPDDERKNCAPIRAKFRRIAVDAMEPVHVRYGHVGSSDDEVTAQNVSFSQI